MSDADLSRPLPLLFIRDHCEQSPRRRAFEGPFCPWRRDKEQKTGRAIQSQVTPGHRLCLVP